MPSSYRPCAHTPRSATAPSRRTPCDRSVRAGGQSRMLLRDEREIVCPANPCRSARRVRGTRVVSVLYPGCCRQTIAAASTVGEICANRARCSAREKGCSRSSPRNCSVDPSRSTRDTTPQSTTPYRSVQDQSHRGIPQAWRFAPRVQSPGCECSCRRRCGRPCPRDHAYRPVHRAAPQRSQRSGRPRVADQGPAVRAGGSRGRAERRPRPRPALSVPASSDTVT